MKEIKGIWFFKGEGDLDRDYQGIRTSRNPFGSFTAGQMVDFLLEKYPHSRIRIESNAENVWSDALGNVWVDDKVQRYSKECN